MYSIAIYLYSAVVHLVALFSPKVRLMLRGQQRTWRTLATLSKEDSYVWFHAASLGEFEQGRPLMERLKAERPKTKILLTFFSPSGYEVRKNYEGADVVVYLPFDTPCNARRFVNSVRIEEAFFIKYEFWRNYITRLYRRDIPVYSVSSIFREHQVFFRWYGYYYARVLHRITHFFVQNESSRLLLRDVLHITDATVVGDTRLDRVLAIRTQAQHLPEVEAFVQGRFTIVAGSTWPVDESFILNYVLRHPDMRLIIAPHVVDQAHLEGIEAQCQGRSVRHSTLVAEGLSAEALADKQILIIDGYGLLSSIYAYGTVAYVGGGFGVGIHNVPEAAVYGIPVIIGPNNAKFQEAQDLKRCGGVVEIVTPEAFASSIDRLRTDAQYLAQSGKAAGHYIQQNAGAVDKIMAHVYKA